MGVPFSREHHGLWAPDREVAPLEDLDKVLHYKVGPVPYRVKDLTTSVRRGRHGQPRTIICHDLDDRYHDRFIFGSAQTDCCRFHYWHLVNVVIYYSRYLVTIPPPGWISAAHTHGTRVLGTVVRHL